MGTITGSNSDSSTIVGTFEGPFAGIVSVVLGDSSLLAEGNTMDGRSIGSGFFVGDGAIITARHVLTKGEAPDILLASNGLNMASPTQLFQTMTTLTAGNVRVFNSAFAEDITLLTTSAAADGANPALSLTTGAEAYVFGVDAFANFESYLQYMASIGTHISVQTSGYGGLDVFTGNEYNGTVLSFRVAEGVLNHAFKTETGGANSYVASDIEIVKNPAADPSDPRNENAFYGFKLGDDGVLDLVNGQSGGPLFSEDTDHNIYRAMGVNVIGGNNRTYNRETGEIVEANHPGGIFEIFNVDQFHSLTGRMWEDGITQPDYVTNRVTGLYSNSSVEVLVGSSYNDVLRGLGAAEGTADYLYGGTGNDIYEYERGFGTLFIFEPESDRISADLDKEDTLYLKDISSKDVRLTRYQSNSDDLAVTIMDENGLDAGYVIIDSQFTYDSAIEKIRFSDKVIDLTKDLTFVGNDTREILYGRFDENDKIYGNGGDDTIYSFSGDDFLIGGDGRNSLYGGADDDTYQFGKVWGRSSITEVSGTDTIAFTHHTYNEIRLTRDIGVNSGFLNIYMVDNEPSEEVEEQAIAVWSHFSDLVGNHVETLTTADGVEIDLLGGLTLKGTAGVDAIQGTDHGDTMYGFKGKDTLYGGKDEDTLVGGEGNDQLVGGADSDIYIFQPGFGFDTISEHGRYHSEVGFGGIDTIVLDGVNPLLVQKVPDGQGRLTINILGLNAEVTDSIFIPSQYFNPADTVLIERLSFGGMGGIDLSVTDGSITGTTDGDMLPGDDEANVIKGLAGNDELVGFNGDDLIEAGIGDDLIHGGLGADDMSGGAGKDVFKGTLTEMNGDRIRDFDSEDTLLVQDMVLRPMNLTVTSGSALLDFDADGDGQPEASVVLEGDYAGQAFEIVSDGVDSTIRLAGVGATQLSASGERFITPDVGVNRVYGDAGDDVIVTSDGADILSGGDGADALLGGAGTDILLGGLGSDVLTGGADADTFAFDVSDFGPGFTADFIRDFVPGEDVIELSGFGLENRASLQFVTVADGDAIDLGEGRFIVLEGLSGAELTQDDVSFSASGRSFGLISTTVVHRLTEVADRFITTDPGANEVRGGSGGDAIVGGDGPDILWGETGDDVLTGGPGKDRLIGGPGADVLTGRDGADVFEFTAGEEIGFTADFITDFSVGEDAVQLDGFGFDSVSDLSWTASASGIALQLQPTHFVVFEGYENESLLTATETDWAFV